MKVITSSHNKSKVLADALHGCDTAVRPCVCVCVCVCVGEAAHVQVREVIAGEKRTITASL